MISLDCSHPDIEEFIRLKTDLTKVTKANISVRIHDDFMEAVKKNEPYHLHYTREATGETIEKMVNARDIFRLIAGDQLGLRGTGRPFLGQDLRLEPAQQYEGIQLCGRQSLRGGTSSGRRQLSSGEHESGRVCQKSFYAGGIL